MNTEMRERGRSWMTTPMTMTMKDLRQQKMDLKMMTRRMRMSSCGESKDKLQLRWWRARSERGKKGHKQGLQVAKTSDRIQTKTRKQITKNNKKKEAEKQRKEKDKTMEEGTECTGVDS